MGVIRVIGGSLRGRRIRVPDRGVRPTAARIREAVFDVLGPKAVLGVRVLDLYAGTGALGIEALSRGASSATFVEGSQAVARRLEENLASLGLAARARVARIDLRRAALPAGLSGPWDLVFLDPPYTGDAGVRWLRVLGGLPWPPGGGMVVYERGRGTESKPPAQWMLATERHYGRTTASFYRAVGAPDRTDEEAS